MNKTKIYFLIVIFNLLLTLVTQAQNPVFTGVSGQYGFIIPHSRELIDVSHTRPAGIEAVLGWHLPATESGIVSRRGFKLSFIDFNNPGVLGHSINAAAFTEPLWAAHHRLFLSVPLEFGLSYTSKVYDKANNPTNLFFSTPVAFYLSAGTRLNWRIHNRFLLHVGVHYQHISNGGVKQPNKGMNFPMAALGLMYYWQEPSWEKYKPDEIFLIHRGLIMNALLFGSLKTIHHPDEKTILCGYQYTLVKRLKRIHGFVAGLEGLWNGYKKVYYNRQGQHVSAYEQSIQAGYEMRFGKTSFQILAGCDVYNERRTTDLFYQRYGLYYQLIPNLKIGGSLKAHRHVADVFDLRIGYTFKTKH